MTGLQPTRNRLFTWKQRNLPNSGSRDSQSQPSWCFAEISLLSQQPNFRLFCDSEASPEFYLAAVINGVRKPLLFDGTTSSLVSNYMLATWQGICQRDANSSDADIFPEYQSSYQMLTEKWVWMIE